MTTGTRDAVDAALRKLSTPNVVTLTVVSANNLVQAVSYQLWVYDSIGKTNEEIEALVTAELLSAFASRPIGGDVIPPATTGALYDGFIRAAILSAVKIDGVGYAFRVALSVPSGDVAMATDDVLVLGGAPTATIVAGLDG